MQNTDNMVPKELIGKRIRKIRKEKGYTVDELANKMGVSQSLISQIERGQVSPSLETLWKLSHAADVPVFYFLKNITSSNIHIRRKDEQKVIRMLHPNVTYRMLSPDIDRPIEVFELIVQPGKVGDFPKRSHQGEEFGYVTKGILEIELEDRTCRLETGDSIYFDSKIEHRFYNPGDEDAIGIWMMFPSR
jgi:transcriptional regulator with XRE-family HTH domain